MAWTTRPRIVSSSSSISSGSGSSILSSTHAEPGVPSLYIFGGIPESEGKRAEKFCTKSNEWVTVKPVPTVRSYFAAAVVHGRIYVIGGRNVKKQVVDSIDCYNPATGTWKTLFGVKPAYPRSEFGAASVRGKIFLIGGYAEACRMVECFDVKLNEISLRRPLERGRWGLGVVACRGRIYAVGGQWYKYKESDEKSRRMSTVYLNDVESYDPIIDRWVREPGMLRRRGYFGLAVYEDALYAVGGVGGECNQRRSRRLDSIEKFDTYTGQWTMIQTTLDGPVSNLAVGVLKSKLLALGGNRDRESSEEHHGDHQGQPRRHSSTFLSSIQVVELKGGSNNVSTARTSPMILSGPRHSFAAVVIDT